MTWSFVATLFQRIESALDRVDSTRLRRASWIALGAGVLLRVVHYAGSRSLFIDEAMLANNLVRTYEQLAGRLGDEQMAPYGFLVVSKFLFGWLGNNDLALRLVPFVASLAALLLFYRLARRLLDDFGAFVAIALMAFAPEVVYYAGEFKPYELDALGAVAVLLAAERYLRKPDGAAFALLAAVGIVGVWFSYPIAFVLGATGSVLFVDALVKRRLRSALAIAAVSVAWLASFALEYWLVTTADADNLAYMTQYWAGYFVTLLPKSADDLRTLWFALSQFLIEGVGFYYYKVAILAAIVGLVAFWRGRPAWAWLLVLPAVIMAAASTLHLYPALPRLLLFMFPACFLLIPAAVSYVRSRPLAYRNTFAVVLAAAFIWPMVRSLAPRVVAHPPFAREEIESVMAQMAKQASPNDRVYVYYGAEPAYRWYAKRFGLASNRALMGRSPRVGWDYFIADAAQFASCGRTWLVFSHLTELAGIDEQRFLLFFADKLGRRLAQFEATGASAYLYDFDGKTDAVSPLELVAVPEEALPPYGWPVQPTELEHATHSWSCASEDKTLTTTDAQPLKNTSTLGAPLSDP